MVGNMRGRLWQCHASASAEIMTGAGVARLNSVGENCEMTVIYCALSGDGFCMQKEVRSFPGTTILLATGWVSVGQIRELQENIKLMWSDNCPKWKKRGEASVGSLNNTQLLAARISVAGSVQQVCNFALVDD